MIDRLEQLHDWLHTELGLSDYSIVPASEDASFRRYYRLEHNNTSWIVMDAPPKHEDCAPYIDIAGRLRACGVNAPKVYNADTELGFLRLTDLGSQLYLDVLEDANADTLYIDALESLIKIQQCVDNTGIPTYSAEQLLQEMDLFRDWLVKQQLGIDLDTGQHEKLDHLFAFLADTALEQPRVFVHRDYHSRNLMYCKKKNPGVVDFQDAVVGPITYDLVSLLKDCYIKWPRAQVNAWVSIFYQRIQSSGYDEAHFLRWFDLMGVQRHLKASGIFARLHLRDGKAGFLDDIPRTLSYILDLEHDYPELGFLIDLIQVRMLPQMERGNLACGP